MESDPVPEQIKDWRVVEWSPGQALFHIDTVANMLARNKSSMAKRVPIDYFPVAFCATTKQAEEICDKADALQRRTPPYKDPTDIIIGNMNP